jgi:hypothetical protein
VDLAVMHSPTERLKSTQQLRITRGESGIGALVIGSELVPKGCLSKETGDVLVEIALGERAPTVGWMKVAFAFGAILFMPPLVSSLLWGFFPFKSPGLGLLGSNFLPGFCIAVLFSVPGIGMLLCVALNSRPTFRGVVTFTVVYGGVFVAGFCILGEAWSSLFPSVSCS